MFLGVMKMGVSVPVEYGPHCMMDSFSLLRIREVCLKHLISSFKKSSIINRTIAKSYELPTGFHLKI